MTPSQNCVDLIKKFEGLYLESYLCPASVATIGFGSTMWTDGKKVKLGEKISIEDAEKLLKYELNNISLNLSKLITNLNQNQFDAICSFVYNLGLGALKSSTLFKKMNDPKSKFLGIKTIPKKLAKNIELIDYNIIRL